MKSKNLGENSNPTLNGHLSQEQIVRQQSLLKPSNPHQPPQDRRSLQIHEPMDDQSRNPTVLDRQGQVRRKAVQSPPNLLQRPDRLHPIQIPFPPFLFFIIPAIATATAATVTATTASSAAAAAVEISDGSNDEGGLVSVIERP